MYGWLALGGSSYFVCINKKNFVFHRFCGFYRVDSDLCISIFFFCVCVVFALSLLRVCGTQKKIVRVLLPPPARTDNDLVETEGGGGGSVP